jgi:hypothetical protein
MPLPNSVELAATRTPGGLLASARPLPEGWTRGIRFAQTGCIDPFTVGECPDSPDLKPLSTVDGVAEFRPYSVGAAVTCTTLDNSRPSAGWAEQAQDATADYAVAYELLTGIASARDSGAGFAGNPSLEGSVTSDLGDATTSLGGLACLESDAATNLKGRQVFLHVSTADMMLSLEGLWRDGARWRTPYGSIVLASAAYPVGTMFATGDVWASVGLRETLLSVERSVNDDEARTEQVALAVFDPCYVGTIGTGLECAGS